MLQQRGVAACQRVLGAAASVASRVLQIMKDASRKTFGRLCAMPWQTNGTPILEAPPGHRGGHCGRHRLEGPAVASRRMARSNGAEGLGEVAERCPNYA